MVEHYQMLFERAMKLWRERGEDYRTMLREYEDLLFQKRILGISPLNKVKATVLKEWPEIPFLDTLAEEDATEFLLNLPESEITGVVIAIDLWVDSYVYNTVKAHIYDYRYEVRHHGEHKNPFGIDPDS